MRRTETKVAWRGLQFPSLGLCRLSKVRSGWQLEGSVSHLDSGGQTLVTYWMLLGRRWETYEVHLRLLGPGDLHKYRFIEGDDEGRGWSVDWTRGNPGG